MLAAEKAAALEMIDFENLKSFIYSDILSTVGQTRDGQPTTLSEEIGEVIRMAGRAWHYNGVNYFRRGAFSAVELTEEQVEERARKMYLRAAKKILFLNAKTKAFGKERFVRPFINLEDEDQVRDLVEMFEYCIQHFDSFGI